MPKHSSRSWTSIMVLISDMPSNINVVNARCWSCVIHILGSIPYDCHICKDVGVLGFWCHWCFVKSCVVLRHSGCWWGPSEVTNEQMKHQDCTSRRIAVSVKLHKLDGSCSWKHQEVAMDAGSRWEESDFKGC